VSTFKSGAARITVPAVRSRPKADEDGILVSASLQEGWRERYMRSGQFVVYLPQLVGNILVNIRKYGRNG
jgi:hypothetical protein